MGVGWLGGHVVLYRGRTTSFRFFLSAACRLDPRTHKLPWQCPHAPGERLTLTSPCTDPHTPSILLSVLGYLSDFTCCMSAYFSACCNCSTHMLCIPNCSLSSCSSGLPVRLHLLPVRQARRLRCVSEMGRTALMCWQGCCGLHAVACFHRAAL